MNGGNRGGPRRGGRGGGGTHGGGATPGGRRMPPPDQTGEEARFLARHKDAHTPMVVVLTDGETVRGWIEYYDRDMIKINRHKGPNVFIRKANIRYLHEDSET